MPASEQKALLGACRDYDDRTCLPLLPAALEMGLDLAVGSLTRELDTI